MELYVDGDSSGFTPDEFDDIKLCLETLLSIRAGSQPLDRNLGINYEKTVGYPLPVAMNMLSLEIMQKVEQYEPRATIDRIEFETSAEEGQLIPHIYFMKSKGGS